jgi:RHS repeat-associated protein
VTNHIGQIHERLEYTPYGELWIDWRSADAPEDGTPFRFTGKELDPETGLYYFGARYLDPKTSRWMSGDPAMGEYIPGAPVNDEVRKQNQNLPGQGGVYNYVNLHVYHYAGNNPVRYVDPNGRENRHVQMLIEKIETTNWAKTDDGVKIVTILKELNAAGRITILDAPRILPDGSIAGGGYDPSDDSISISRSDTRWGMEIMASDLGHEGMHALQLREGDIVYNPETQTLLHYDFTDERRAYDVRDTLRSELLYGGSPYSPKTTDEYIHYWYDHLFDE